MSATRKTAFALKFFGKSHFKSGKLILPSTYPSTATSNKQEKN